MVALSNASQYVEQNYDCLAFLSLHPFVGARECARYGKVEECVIFELLDAAVPESEAVRIFVRFATRAGAAAAVADLDGRFFDGRAVRAAYWNEDKFERRELM